MHERLWVSSLRDERLVRSARLFLNSHIDRGERELARGRMQELDYLDPDRPSMISTGSASDVLIVTQERMLWVGSEPQWVTSLPFTHVTVSTEVTQGHRYALILDHREITRLQCVPEHRFLWWAWGNAEDYRRRSRSVLGFSHRDTRAVRAIRARLAALGVPTGSPITWPHRRSEAHTVLYRRRRSTWLRWLRRRRPRAFRWPVQRRPR